MLKAAVAAPLALAAAALTLGSCGQPRQIYVDHAWVRLSAVTGHPAAAYFTLHGGKADTALISVTSPAAISTQMHRTENQNGVSKMVPLQQVALPAGGKVTFEPGVMHVMLFDIAPSVKPGGTVNLHFVFANGVQIETGANAVAAGAPAPKS